LDNTHLLNFFQIILLTVFFILVGIAMIYDIRRRTFPAWIGWALYGLAIVYVSSAGSWNRLVILLATFLGFRFRRAGIGVMAVMTTIILIAGWQEGIWLSLLTLTMYYLFYFGWLGACDAEIAFPLIALLGDGMLALYLLGYWILIPPIVVIFKRGVRGGLRRFADVAFRLFLRGESPPQDEQALRLPWAVDPFLAMTIYLFLFPALYITLWKHLLP
jgi:hypothetical protein